MADAYRSMRRAASHVMLGDERHCMAACTAAGAAAHSLLLTSVRSSCCASLPPSTLDPRRDSLHALRYDELLRAGGEVSRSSPGERRPKYPVPTVVICPHACLSGLPWPASSAVVHSATGSLLPPVPCRPRRRLVGSRLSTRAFCIATRVQARKSRPQGQGRASQ